MAPLRGGRRLSSPYRSMSGFSFSACGLSRARAPLTALATTAASGAHCI